MPVELCETSIFEGSTSDRAVASRDEAITQVITLFDINHCIEHISFKT